MRSYNDGGRLPRRGERPKSAVTLLTVPCDPVPDGPCVDCPVRSGALAPV